MKRIIVIGCPGSGKSTFSRALSDKTGIPLYHLDMMFWNADKTTVSRDVFTSRLAEVMGGCEWIIDGNYLSTMELRLSLCDTVFFLDYPTEVCLSGIRERIGAPRPDMPWTETAEDAEFMQYARHFAKEQRPEVLRLLEKYGEKNLHVFKSRAQADAFLNG